MISCKRYIGKFLIVENLISTSIKGRMVQNTLNPFIQKGSTDPQTGGLFIQMEIRLETPEIAKGGTDAERGDEH